MAGTAGHVKLCKLERTWVQRPPLRLSVCSLRSALNKLSVALS
jgi:hypothetical protein